MTKLAIALLFAVGTLSTASAEETDPKCRFDGKYIYFAISNPTAAEKRCEVECGYFDNVGAMHEESCDGRIPQGVHDYQFCTKVVPEPAVSSHYTNSSCR